MCAPHVTRMVMAAAAVLWSTCLSIRTHAEAVFPAYLARTVERAASGDCCKTGRDARVEPGIFNLNYLFAVELRKHGFTLPAGHEDDKKPASRSSSNDLDDLDGYKQPLPDQTLDQDLATIPDLQPGFNWNAATKQSMIFLGLMHAFRFATEPGTRAELKGPFFKDYFNTVKSLRGWRDGDPAWVNYLGHPLQGSVSGFIQIHNDPKGLKQEVDLKNKQYWKSRLKAFGWAAAWSTQFELGPLSEASLGNVGLKPNKTSRHPMGYVDLVVTPVLGTAWLVGEDLLDRYVIRFIERKIPNRTVTIVFRGLFNPTRSFANIHRGRWFWRREDRP
jgi:hypothetical protein